MIAPGAARATSFSCEMEKTYLWDVQRDRARHLMWLWLCSLLFGGSHVTRSCCLWERKDPGRSSCHKEQTKKRQAGTTLLQPYMWIRWPQGRVAICAGISHEKGFVRSRGIRPSDKMVLYRESD